jgi:phage terminase Nu1 subunit (DNA packaging protein)
MTDVTAEEMAALCGLSSAAVASLTRRGIMQRGGKGKLKLEPSIRAYCEHLREQARGRKVGDTPGKDRARLAKAMADSVELKNARARAMVATSMGSIL